ncbi:ABC transporter ATP-binding protein [Paenibacillus oenotherae]|uniref:ABC transporter ATP-binding protein n=1 Tax=Paenibacillus oenotherae TaxID=1435645 RepID=A0ABS7DE48_9BACL|nr:ABC transporter ATP-binding protein [Paenibacillus oenotherae]MBW7477443.1 ABC transporter ATP-binding protein [Paenibacillus oenotherae]
MNEEQHIGIELKDIVKSYRMGGEMVTTLRGISLHVYSGEFLAIVGPSGSGKSTLMNIIGCLDTPSSGSYTIDGQDTSRLSDNRLAEIRNHKIGFIFQSFHLLTQLTALENVELPLVYRGLSSRQRRERAVTALTRMGLQDRMHHKPKELSGGQQQRVAIARALAGNPTILLADEPTGALDTKTGREVLHIFDELHKAGHTIVLITHDPEVAERAESVVRITDGVLTEERRGRHALQSRRPDGLEEHSL